MDHLLDLVLTSRDLHLLLLVLSKDLGHPLHPWVLLSHVRILLHWIEVGRDMTSTTSRPNDLIEVDGTSGLLPSVANLRHGRDGLSREYLSRADPTIVMPIRLADMRSHVPNLIGPSWIDSSFGTLYHRKCENGRHNGFRRDLKQD